MNYFELFGIPVGFNTAKAELAQRYFELQKKFHPDFHAQSTEFEQADALEQSSILNKALKTLRNPDATLKYILQLKGMLEEDEKYQLPPDFLMEMMDLNESMGEHTPAHIQALENDLALPIKPILEQYDDAHIDNASLLKLKEYYYKKKYLQRILDRTEG